jgi:hypothetical protein
MLTIAVILALAGHAVADDSIEFFERKIRPLFVEHCHSCHSAGSKKIKGGLKLDSREAALKGGDTGPAIVPGSPEKSRLIGAISYKNVDLQMPPKAKLPDSAIADLAKWIKDGAAWPAGPAAKVDAKTYAFDLAQRKRDHWAWQPIKPAATPIAVDRFLNAELEKHGLAPGPATEPRVILRRLSFDLVGLPPPSTMIDTFEKAYAANPKRAIAAAIDEFMASPHFGERWARHWLDLVRYAESRGHEFDYTLPNAYQYRDYVIRAFNENVPYDQFVREHIAGDLLPSPRLHRKDDSNESILGTGFWYLGEQVHSPVDICQDRADRVDNQIDVFSKTFLGLTVACARCHDHKFDAISTKDYYALAGFIESSSYRQAPFQTMEHNRTVAAELWKSDAQMRDRRKAMPKEQSVHYEKSLMDLEDYLEEARAILQKGTSAVPALKKKSMDANRIALWVEHLQAAAKQARDPFHAYANEILGAPLPVRSSAAKIDVVVDYKECPPDAWLPDGVAFGPGPVQAGALIDNAVMVESASVFDGAWINLKATGAESEPGPVGRLMRAGCTIRTPRFSINDAFIHVRMRGGAQVYAAVEGHVMISGPLHGSLVRSVKSSREFRWHAIDLRPYAGRRVHLEFTPEDANFALARVVQSAASSLDDDLESAPEVSEWDGVTKRVPLPQQAARLRSHLAVAVSKVADGPPLPIEAHRFNWLRDHSKLFPGQPWNQWLPTYPSMGPVLGAQKNQSISQILWLKERRLDSKLAPAIMDGSAVDESVFIRGNYKTPGEIVPRRFLEALVGPEPINSPHGSGRLELARQITDPALNPLFARVFVNRVWHHLFGRGIVASVDNFGVLGDAPTHPELLDALAEQFVKDNYSVKSLIRRILLTDAYQRSSRPSAQAAKVDPENRLLQHVRVRRLEGEAIRDAILSVSGRLDAKLYGPSVPVHLTDFQQGRGRPTSGPMDGAGRRSIYLSVRRNFLSPFLLAFDTPIPFSTVGRRTVSNVPAQALILLNDPFVHQQADLWAKRALGDAGTFDERVERMYRAAFGRGPTAAEVAACRDFVRSGDAAAWASLAHALINAKEFIFLE